MKKVITLLLTLTMLCLIPFACFGCSKEKNVQLYDPSKYTETIDLTKYKLVFSDDFRGELNRDIWGDTRQGTRRDGFWTKNLAFTEAGNLVIRTEKRGSRFCSETRERQIVGYNDTTVKITYDDCTPFGMIAGDFGDVSTILCHTYDLVGDVILSEFETLASTFAAFISEADLPIGEAKYVPALGAEALTAYTPFYEKAMRLYNYYSFVVDTKTVRTTLPQSAVIGANGRYALTFGSEIDPNTIEFQTLLAHLFGFETEEAFMLCAQTLADTYATYRRNFARNGVVDDALESGCFRAENKSFIFPVAIQNDSDIVLTYVIVDAEGHVSVWINDLAAALRAINYNETYFSGERVSNETYCKNVLFVTGPEGVYSGAVRTLDKYTHGFGYYEISCKLPSVEGIWHAFWMMCGNVYSEENGSTDGIEIDVFEYLPARDAVNVALHWDGYDEAHKNAHMRFDKTGLADGEFHTFGMNWDEEGYTFYIDGRKVWHSTGGGICHEEGYLKISTEYGEWGDWVGKLDIGDLPVDWIIDYVKVYEKLPARNA